MKPALSPSLAPAALMAALLMAALAGTATPVRAQGLQLKPQVQSAWQARVQLSSSQDSGPDGVLRGSRLLSANLLGDYYLTGSGLGQNIGGGLRATGGLLLGPLSLTQSSAGLALGRGASVSPYLSASMRNLGGWSAGSPADREPSASLSYVGLGYSSYALRGGWGFSADLGVMAGSSYGPRLGDPRGQALDDTLRDLRFKPVLQLGLSYSF